MIGPARRDAAAVGRNSEASLRRAAHHATASSIGSAWGAQYAALLRPTKATELGAASRTAAMFSFPSRRPSSRFSPSCDARDELDSIEAPARGPSGAVCAGAAARADVWSRPCRPVAAWHRRHPSRCVQRTTIAQGDLAKKPGAPGQHNPDDDFCAICASIALAGSLVVPATPALDLPPTTERVWVRQAEARQALRPPRLSFQARAPPV